MTSSEGGAVRVSLRVNGRAHAVTVDPSTPLLYVLRNELGLNGAKYGCGVGRCGACVVQIDGATAFSCVVPVAAAQGRAIRTIEGLGTASAPGRLQKAFADEQAAQCGYCTAGMIMRAQELLDAKARPSDAELREHMQPNLCRCGAHLRILRAVRRALDPAIKPADTAP